MHISSGGESSSSLEVSIFSGTGDGFPEGSGALDNEGTVCARGMREGRNDGCGGA